jgi:hypothetical protein
MDIIQEALYGRSQNLTEASEDAPGILPQLEHFQADEIIVKHFPIAKKLGGIISFLTGGRLLSGYVYFHAVISISGIFPLSQLQQCRS